VGTRRRIAAALPELVEAGAWQSSQWLKCEQ
jgi:hypothetical protein